MGHRPQNMEICYPVDAVARRHGASVEKETTNPGEAYAGVKRRPMSPVWPLYGVD